MLRTRWLALAATALAGWATTAQAQTPAPVNPPNLSFDDGHVHDASCHNGVNGGATVYYLRPWINNNNAFTITTGIGSTAPAAQAAVSQEFDWNFHVTPSAWIGWTSRCGLGVRVGYFILDADSNTAGVSNSDPDATLVTPPPGLTPPVTTSTFGSPSVFLQNIGGTDVMTFDSDLHIQTLDFETTYAHDCGSLSWILSVGGRWLQMHQGYHATLLNGPAAAPNELATLDVGHNFHGAGPTVGWEGRWRIGHSCVSAFGSVRGSLLVGSSSFNSLLREFVGGSTAIPSTSSEQSVVLPMAELELGVEYGRDVGHSRMFFRGAVVDKTLFDAGSASSRDGNLSLFGAQLSVGLNY